MGRKTKMPLSLVTAGGRLAVTDQKYMSAFFRSHVPRWYPGWKFESLTIHDYSQYHFKKTIMYRLRTRHAGLESRWQTLRGNVPSLDTTWEAKNSANAMKEIWRYGRRAPVISRPLGFFSTLRLLLYEDIPGRPLSDLLNVNRAAPSLVRQAGAWLGQLHSLHLNHRHRRSLSREKLEAHYFQVSFRFYWPAVSQQVSGILQDFFRRHRQLQRNITSHSRLIHGDFNFNNIIVNQQGVAVIDFGNAWWFDPMYDLSNAIFQIHLFTRRRGQTFQSGQRLVQQFMRGYRRHQSLSASDYARLEMFLPWWAVQTASYTIARPARNRKTMARYALSLIQRLNDLGF